MMVLWKCATRNRLLCTWKSAGGTAISTPVMPPTTKVIMKPIDHSIGTVKRTRPPYMVNSQLKIFTPVGTAMIMVMTPKKPLTFGAGAHGEEVVQPDQEGQHADRHGGGDHGAVAEQRLAGEGRDDLGVDAERRQDEDIDLGMAPDPEQVDVHHGVAAGRRP